MRLRTDRTVMEEYCNECRDEVDEVESHHAQATEHNGVKRDLEPTKELNEVENLEPAKKLNVGQPHGELAPTSRSPTNAACTVPPPAACTAPPPAPSSNQLPAFPVLNNLGLDLNKAPWPATDLIPLFLGFSLASSARYPGAHADRRLPRLGRHLVPAASSWGWRDGFGPARASDVERAASPTSASPQG